MKPTHRDDLDETRADIARRRLAQLVASFDAELPPPDETPVQAARPRIEIPHARAVVTVAVAACVLLGWWLLAGRPETSDPVAPLAFTESETPGPGHPSARPSAGAADTASPQQLIIDVTGKVKHPGIVTLAKGSRVYQAIEAAGGVKGAVDTTALNLARELTDGEQVLVGLDPVDVAGAAVTPGQPAAAGAAAAGVKVNLNTATAEQLDTLPGVGPVTAQAILGWRDTNGRFTAVDDLLDVKGIGETTLAELRELVVV
ncbi:MAG: helix-hairpin-helix domain-containing protein [Aeromicrobium sp.]